MRRGSLSHVIDMVIPNQNLRVNSSKSYFNEWSFWNAYNGNSYKLIMPEVFTEENKKIHSSLKNQGSNNGRAKLTETDVLKIRSLWKEGITRQELYELYPQVNPSTIRGVINNKTWKNLL